LGLVCGIGIVYLGRRVWSNKNIFPKRAGSLAPWGLTFEEENMDKETKEDIIFVILMGAGIIVFCIAAILFIGALVNMMNAPVPDFMNITNLEG
jgi:hypothetical protein